MADLVQIPDTTMVRDIHSKALLNTDRAGLQDYYTKREIAKRQNFAQVETKQRLDTIESEMQEIKSLLRDLIQVRGN
jgi:phage-related baseplate assembly protein